LFIIADVVLLLFFSSVNYRTALEPEDLEKQYEPCQDCIQPDVYHIVFDTYTSSSTLKSVFGYDNGRLDRFLLSKGFFMATASKSNYNLTPFSLGSTFNMQYFKGLDTTGKFLMKRFLPGIYGMYETALQKIMISQGYSIINNSIFRMKNFPPKVQPPDIWAYDFLYERHNILKRFDMDIGWLIRTMLGVGPRKNDYADKRDKHVEYVYHTLLNLVETNFKKPKFVYSHFMLPHYPYTFDSAGKKITDDQALILEEEKKRYVNQLIYTNKLITQLIDQILKRPPRPVVIVLQGDHGFKFHDPTMKEQEFPNLHAVYFFNGDYRFLKQSMSPVNTYRAVLNTFFKQKYPLIEDKSYFLSYY
jgi:hypothetical protein